MHGLEHISVREPQRVLPDDWEDKRILLKCVGGIGDTLISIGGAARKLYCYVTAAVMPYQIPLVGQLLGVSKVISAQRTNDPKVRSEYDVFIDFAGCFNLKRQLKSDDYYKLASERLGLDFGPGLFTFHTNQTPLSIAAIHPGASNPNRQWPQERWRELAYALAAREYAVTFLGTKDEFGFNDEDNNIVKLSDVDDSLLYQCRYLSNCELFFGNDSGFLHAAGLLGVRGVGVFGCTHPDDVICRYRRLVGVHNHSSHYSPSRSLVVDDQASREALRSVSLLQVLCAARVAASKKLIVRNELPPTRLPVCVVGSGDGADRLLEFLNKYYSVRRLNDTVEAKPSDVVLEITDRCRIIHGSTKATVSLDSFESVRRAIREILGGGR